jgi:hypothetical protein
MCAPWADTQVRPYRAGMDGVGAVREPPLRPWASPRNPHSSANRPPQEDPPPEVQP